MAPRKKIISELETLETFRLDFLLLFNNVIVPKTYYCEMDTISTINLYKLIESKSIALEVQGTVNASFKIRTKTENDIEILNVSLTNIMSIEHTIPKFKEVL